MKTTTAIIGGSGLAKLSGLRIHEREIIRTPYGEPSSPLVSGVLVGEGLIFLARHGHGHTIPPHKVNYRANIWALKEMGVRCILAVGAVGAINPAYQCGDLIIPDNLIDYTFSRPHTFFDGESKKVHHADLTYPYSPRLRQTLIECAQKQGISVHAQGVYAVSQGPRLETAAEIRKFKNDGADIVGMTSMPEAALARELEMEYALIALAVNPAAGMASKEISIEQVMQTLAENKHRIVDLISASLKSINRLAD